MTWSYLAACSELEDGQWGSQLGFADKSDFQ